MTCRLALLPFAILLAACSEPEPAGPGADVRCVAGCDGGAVDFGVTAVGERAERRIVLRNLGPVPARIREVRGDTLRGGFDAVDVACGAHACGERIVAPQGELAVRIGYRPASDVAAEATLALGPDGPTLQLRGTGGHPSIRCTDAIDFGTVVKNEVAQRTR